MPSAAWAAVAPAPDSSGPVVTGVSVTPDPTDLATAPVLRATADDSTAGGSAVVAAEAFVDVPGPDGTGLPLRTRDPGSGEHGPGR